MSLSERGASIPRSRQLGSNRRINAESSWQEMPGADFYKANTETASDAACGIYMPAIAYPTLNSLATVQLIPQNVDCILIYHASYLGCIIDKARSELICVPNRAVP